MSERDLLIVIFAPATVGLVVMASRRLPIALYLATALAIFALALLSLGGHPLGTDLPLLGRLILATVLLGLPTLAAFGCGRLTATHLGGAYVFAVSCTAYLVGLGLAALLTGPSRLWIP
jgi:hypothetical protein